MRVLVVDDEPGIVDVISMALRHHGFGVETAGSGKEALAEVRLWRPHVMVLDVVLTRAQLLDHVWSASEITITL